MKNSEFNLQNVKCAGCVGKIQSRLNSIAGVNQAQVNLLDKTLFVEYSADKLDQLIIDEVTKLGFGASLEQIAERQTNIWLSIVLPLVLGGLLMTVGMLPAFMFDLHTSAGFVLGVLYALISLAVVCAVGRTIIKSGWLGFITLNFNMHSLILLGVGSAWIYSCAVVGLSYFTELKLVQHLYFESALIILGLINLGADLEERAKQNTTAAIRGLTKLVPERTIVIEDGKEIIVASNLLRTDYLVKIRPGEQLPADGEVVSGSGYVNESMLTGEPLAILRKAGDLVIAGSINESSSFIYRLTKVGSNTVLAGIIQLVKTAQLTKPKLAKLADKTAKIFVPSILIIASLSAVIWYFVAQQNPAYHALEVFMTVLLIACPCSVGLAVPVALMVGVGRGASQGILIRDSSVLSYADNLNMVVLDKTGTITQGKPEVVNITTAQNESIENILSILKSLELNSEHPLARAVVTYAAQAQELNVTNFESLAGNGVMGIIQNKFYTAVSKRRAGEVAKYNLELLIDTPTSQIYLLRDEVILARVEIADNPKDDSALAIKQLQEMGLEVVMLTGDNQASANECAKSVDIKTVIANCQPADKIAFIKQQQDLGKIVAFVGDGINDAPSLAQANFGIAMSGGTDIARQSSAIVLMRNSLVDVSRAVLLARKINQNMRQNLFGSFVYNGCAVLIATGVFYPWWHVLLNPVIASVVMSLSSITVVSNALRLRNA